MRSALRLKSVVENSGNVRVDPQVTLEVLDPEGAIIFNQAFQQESIFAGETRILAEYYRTIGVINGGDTERTFAFKTFGGMEEWITFVDEQDRSLELEEVTAGPNSEARVLVRLRVPSDAANGSYDSVLQVLAIGVFKLLGWTDTKRTSSC